MQINFQAGVEDIYDACVAKGSTPASTSLADVVAGIMAIPGATTHTETYTASSRGAALDMGETHNYRYVNTNSVPNTNSDTYTASSSSAALDMGATNSYRYVNTSALTKVSGTKSITANGNSQNVAAYQYVNVSVNRTLYVWHNDRNVHICRTNAWNSSVLCNFSATSSGGSNEYITSFSAMG